MFEQLVTNFGRNDYLKILGLDTNVHVIGLVLMQRHHWMWQVQRMGKEQEISEEMEMERTFRS